MKTYVIHIITINPDRHIHPETDVQHDAQFHKKNISCPPE